MAATPFQKQIADRVIMRCAERGIMTFDQGMCESIARSFFGKKVVYGAGGVQWRVIRGLVKQNFKKRVTEALNALIELSKKPSEPPVEPEESKLGSGLLI